MENMLKTLLVEESEEVDELRCALCKQYLNRTPIVHSDTFGSVCGRDECSKFANAKGTCYRQSTYEALAKFLEFPCMYKRNGCQEVLSWNAVEEHEKNCNYLKFKCPISTEHFKEAEKECSWEGFTSELLEHMDNIHPDNRFEKQIQIDLEKGITKNTVFFSSIQNNIVILLVVIDSRNESHWKVWGGSNIFGELKYKIEVSSKEGNTLMASKLKQAEFLHPAFYKSQFNNSWFKVDFDIIKNLFESPSYITVLFYMNDFKIGSSQNIFHNPAAIMLNNLICTRCKNNSHISYICTKNHKNCASCRVRGNLCPLCGERMNPYERYEHLKFLAKTSGCRLCGNEVDCLSSHLYNSHYPFIFQLDTIYRNFSLDTFFFAFDNHVFLLSKTIDEYNLSFSVQCLETQHVKYKYELQLSSDSSFSSITFTSYCHPELIQTKCSLTNCYGNKTCIPQNFLTKMFPDVNDIQFKMNIYHFKDESIRPRSADCLFTFKALPSTVTLS